MTQALDVLVILGTDHHQFQRLVGWVDEWASAHPDRSVLVQHGSTPAPIHARGRALVPHEELRELMRAAVVVVTHGGPATIVEVRELGKRPVVMPRDPERGEHVDGHQLLFTARFSASGLVSRVTTRRELEEALDNAIADPASMRVEQAELDEHRSEVAESVRRAGAIIDELAARTGSG